MSEAPSRYYVPEQSIWPIVGSIALFTLVVGAANLIHGHVAGLPLILLGVLILTVMLVGWFGNVIHESMAGMYSPQLDRSFRLGMQWFIFSEVMFFAIFFGALFYVRYLALPWLGGEGARGITGMLWPNFDSVWPLMVNPDTSIQGPQETIPWAGIPLLNTALLISSGLTITWAHRALRKMQRTQLIIGMLATVLLGLAFLYFQIHEYGEAYQHLGLTLDSGIYGTTFFMLTGFHGLHVTLGTIMLIAILIRCMKGHFTPKNHFAFEGVAWYWHFVDFVWIALFIFVYIV